MRDLLGGKGANLSEMARLGLPVPPGFVISTDGFREFARLDQQLPESLWQEVQEALILHHGQGAAHAAGQHQHVEGVQVQVGQGRVGQHADAARAEHGTGFE